MTTIRSHRDLVAGQKALEFGLLVYKATAEFPEHERFGLTSQLRRAAVSVSSNIAEGYGRASTSDYLRFLRIARGSLFEIDTQLMFAVRLGYMSESSHGEALERCRESGRVLAGLIRAVEESDANPGSQH
jgi:four helix bundle protein